MSWTLVIVVVLKRKNINERFYGDFMFEPCYKHCYLRFGKQYTSDCDDKCAYAKVIKERDKAIEFIKYLDNLYIEKGKKSIYFEVYTKRQLLQAIEIIKSYGQ